jgi:hypothetical protein
MCVQNVTHVGSPPLFRLWPWFHQIFQFVGLQFHPVVAVELSGTAKLNTAIACEFFVSFRSLAEGRKLVYLISRGLF